MLGLFKALRGNALGRYEVGEAIQQDVLLADIEIDRIKERLELLNPEKERLQAEINALLNRPPSQPLGIPERLEPAKLGSSLDDLVQTAKVSSPAVQEMHRLTDRDRIRLKYAKAAYIPDFRLSAGYGDREGLSPQWSVGLGIELPLYFWRKEVYGVKEPRPTSLRASRPSRIHSRIRSPKYGLPTLKPSRPSAWLLSTVSTSSPRLGPRSNPRWRATAWAGSISWAS